MLLKNIKTNEIADFAVIQNGWTELTQAEIDIYLLANAKKKKEQDLNSFYSSSQCWQYTIFTEIKVRASLTRDADFFAKLLPASAGRDIQVFDDNNQLINYSLTVEKASNLNYKINCQNGSLLKAKKLELENRIQLATKIEDINNIDIQNELLNAVERQINLDLIK